MSEGETFPCPNCGALVSNSDEYCRKCGAPLLEPPRTAQETPESPQSLLEEPYVRRLSLIQRFYKLLIAPSEAMRDIALAPDYGGVLVVIALEVVFLSVALGLVLQKIRLSGPYTAAVSGMVSGILVAAIFLSGILLVVKWVIKSLIVKYACDNGSGWSLKTAMSVTGYAYIANIIVSVLGMCIAWFLLPTIHLDTTDLETMRQVISDYEAQLNWLNLVYTLPFSLFGLLWKSYLGGLGAHFGTKEKCSLGMGVAIFIVLGSIGLLLLFIT